MFILYIYHIIVQPLYIYHHCYLSLKLVLYYQLFAYWSLCGHFQRILLMLGVSTLPSNIVHWGLVLALFYSFYFFVG